MSLIGLILLGVGGFAFFMFLKSRASAPALGDVDQARDLPPKAGRAAIAAPDGEKTALTLALNDIVTHLDQDFMIEGKLTYREDGDEWWEYRLVDGDDEAYLCVEDDDRLEVSLWREIDVHIPEAGPPEEIVFDGDRYRCVERGEADVTRDGKTGRKTGMSCRYWDYEGAGGKLLGVERWGGAYETWSGKELEEGRYDILPGDLIQG
jgi:hypothetical protein